MFNDHEDIVAGKLLLIYNTEYLSVARSGQYKVAPSCECHYNTSSGRPSMLWECYLHWQQADRRQQP